VLCIVKRNCPSTCPWTATPRARVSCARVVGVVEKNRRGLDQKVTLPNFRSNWSNAEFEVVRASEPGYATLEASWARQSEWGLDIPLSRLGNHSLAAAVAAAWNDTLPAVPSTNGTKFVSPDDLRKQPHFVLGQFVVGFDPDTGAIAHLNDTVTDTVWASFGDASSSIALLDYRTYSQDNYTLFMLEYNYLGPLFFVDDGDDFDKIGIDGAGATYREVQPTLVGVYVDTSGPSSVFHLQLQMPADTVAVAGGAPLLWVTVQLGAAPSTVDVTVQVSAPPANL
jgi:hypothetical protein